MTVSPPVIAERYRLLHPLGSGGMGRVWLARDEILNRDVAIKEVTLPPDLTPEEREDLQSRTLREAQTAARLSHPNVVQIYDVVHTDEQPWIVMEYVRSRSLQEIITTDGPLEPRHTARIGLAVLGALRAAHQAGVLHRDVKPGNVLIADDGRIVLGDFGLATFDGGAVVTRPGLVWGSPEYVAPERARHGDSTVEADLWSLGATLFAAVEGHSPYRRSTAMATLTALATEKPPSARHSGPLKPVLTGLLRKEPRNRLSADEAERLLRRVAEAERRPLPRPRRAPRPQQPADEPPPVAPPPEVRRRPQWVAGAAALLAVAASAVLLVYAVTRPSDGRQPAWSPPPSSVSATPSGTPVALGPAIAGDRVTPPPGWGFYQDPDGFRLAVPETWLMTRDATSVRFFEPTGLRVIAVETWTGADPMAVQLAREREAAATRHNYQRIGMDPIDYFAGGAAWRCAWDNAAGVRLQSINWRFRTVSGRGYALSWTTAVSEANTFYFQTVSSTFRPIET